MQWVATYVDKQAMAIIKEEREREKERERERDHYFNG